MAGETLQVTTEHQLLRGKREEEELQRKLARMLQKEQLQTSKVCSYIATGFDPEVGCALLFPTQPSAQIVS